MQGIKDATDTTYAQFQTLISYIEASRVTHSCTLALLMSRHWS